MKVAEAIRRLQTMNPEAILAIPNDGLSGIRSGFVECAFMEESTHAMYPPVNGSTAVIVALRSKAPVESTPDTGGMLRLGEYP